MLMYGNYTVFTVMCHYRELSFSCLVASKQNHDILLSSNSNYTIMVTFRLYSWERYESPYAPITLLFFYKYGFGIK